MQTYKGTFLDPVELEPFTGYLSVEDGRVAGLDRRAPGGAEVTPLPGVVVPGLVDAHVHLTMSGGLDPTADLEKWDDAYLLARAAGYLRGYLAAGVTAVRDLGSRAGSAIGLAQAVAQGLLEGPRVVAAGPVITPTGGHGWKFGIEADGSEGVRRAARAVFKQGATAIKFMATGGVMTPGVKAGAEMFDEEEMRAGVREAEKRGAVSAAHAQGLAGIKNAVRAGVRTIEHGAFDGWDEEVFELMKRQGTVLVPTLAAPDGILRGEGRVPAFMVEKTRPIAERHRANTLEAYRAGVPIAAGTDAGTPLNGHPNLARELALLAEVGLELPDVLRAATTVASRALGHEDELGRIAPGYAADLVALDGDPLESAAAYARPLATVRAGRLWTG
ncbi:amidohydrolase family protein [Oceanithermus sp.]|uniref:metal-dependent hydrolase family protein n=1 Tax=Oceanithermus sp. TaxID=2268145 RepID=UPI0025E13399|nr:amidohydrolase family protein [Oceanithermus sp.]